MEGEEDEEDEKGKEGIVQRIAYRSTEKTPDDRKQKTERGKEELVRKESRKEPSLKISVASVIPSSRRKNSIWVREVSKIVRSILNARKIRSGK